MERVTDQDVPDEARLAELVKSVREGAPDAKNGLHEIFYRGACFLARRRAGHSDVDAEVQLVLDKVVLRICDDHSIDGSSLPSLVRRTLAESIPAKMQPGRNDSDRPSVNVATGILKSLSPVEQDALKRCYVEGQAPESFLDTIRMTPDQFRAIRAKARTEFRTKTHQVQVA